MRTLQKSTDESIVSVSTADYAVDDLLSREWLLTNGRGGYSSSTIIGCNTRRYHGLLIGSLEPPANRIMALSNCLEMIISNGQVLNLSTFEFSDKFAPAGFGYIKRFRRDIGVHFDYQLGRLELTKSIYLLRDSNSVVLEYDFSSVVEAFEFIIRPFAGLRDFHTLQKSYAELCAEWVNNGLLIRHDVVSSCELFLRCSAANFEKDPQWWFDFVYRCDRQRGQDFTEDLWSPGFFKCRIVKPTKIIFQASLSYRFRPQGAANIDIEAVCEDLRRHRSAITAAVKTQDEKLRRLYLAAEQFIINCKSKIENHKPSSGRVTVLAGFPWFMDWGRDAFIALPGLLLLTGRFEQAKSVLTTFAAVVEEGMVPNRFDDRSDTAYFNSIDASLWFINAAFEYLKATGDHETFNQLLLPTIRQIIESYHNGTRFGICADADGLITAGSSTTQLTWMDAKYEGVAFTPRYGKTVEVNALWYNGLCRLAQFFADSDAAAAQHYQSMADKVATAFVGSFWNEKAGCLNDCVLPDGSVDASVRPNQLFAVSLPFSALSAQQQKCVVDVVQKELLTPYGLRTLNTQDGRYKGTCIGSPRERDEAYHQGTVWPFLLGPFIEAYLKVNDFSAESKEQALKFIEPLLQHLTLNGCLGQINEIFDGDAPHKPRGCFAQAWSVGELIRAYHLIND